MICHEVFSAMLVCLCCLAVIYYGTVWGWDCHIIDSNHFEQCEVGANMFQLRSTIAHISINFHYKTGDKASEEVSSIMEIFWVI